MTAFVDVDRDDAKTTNSPSEMTAEGPNAADVQFLVRRSMTKGYQLFSFLTPPAYAAFILARKGRAQFSINRFLRATWVGGAVGKVLAYFICFVVQSWSRMRGWGRV
jgi:hypothetical protein